MAVPLPPSTYKGPIDDSINGTQQGADLVNANQAQAAAMGVKIPGSTYQAPTSTTPAAPIDRTITSSTPAPDPAQAFLDQPFKQPEDEATIAERLRQQSQALIDSQNKVYDDQVAQSKQRGQERLNQNNATDVLAGLMGSSEAGAHRNTVSDANDKEVAAINNQRALALAQIYGKINDSAKEEAQHQLTDATKSAEDIVARRKQVQTEAVGNLKEMASGGLVDFDAFKNNPQNSGAYQHALDAVGGSEDTLRGIFALNRPKDQLVGSPQRVGDHYVQAYQNPITGKVSYDTVNVPGGIPTNYNNFQKLGDNIVAIPDGWDGDVSKLKTIIGQPDTMKSLQEESLRLDIQKKQNTINDQGDTSSGLAQQLVNGQLAPSELSKRATGSGAYNDVLKAADEYSMKTTGKHFNIAQADRNYKFATRPQTQDTLNYLGSLVGQGGNLDELKAKSNAVNRTSLPALNNAAAWSRLESGDPAIANFRVTATEVADQIAKILQGGGSGSGTSDAKLQQAADLFNTGFSKDQLNGIIDTVKPLLMNRARSMVQGNPYLSDYSDQFGFDNTTKGSNTSQSDSDPLGLGI